MAVLGDIVGLSIPLLNRIDAASRELGHDLRVRSGYRSHVEQQALYDKWMRGRHLPPSQRPPLAAKPGSSWHEFRGAADMERINGVHTRDIPRVRAVFARHDLLWTVASESWHISAGHDLQRGKSATLAGPHWSGANRYTTIKESDVALSDADVEKIAARTRDLILGADAHGQGVRERLHDADVQSAQARDNSEAALDILRAQARA